MENKVTWGDRRNFFILLLLVLVAGTGMLVWGQYNTAVQVFDVAFTGYDIGLQLSQDEGWNKSGDDEVIYNELLSKAAHWRSTTKKRTEQFTAASAAKVYGKHDPLEMQYEFYENNSDKTVIILHAYNENLDDAAVFAPFWYEIGFNVLLLQMRAHSEVQSVCTFGVYEQYDLYDLIMHEGLSGEDKKLILHGKGIGAAAALLMASNRELMSDISVELIISDTTYSNLKNMELTQLKRQFSLGDFMVGMMLDRVVKSELGFDIDSVDLRYAAGNIEVPVMFVCGADDEFIGAEETRSVYSTAASEKSLLEIENASYSMCYAVSVSGEGEYETGIINWLKTIGLFEK